MPYLDVNQTTLYYEDTGDPAPGVPAERARTGQPLLLLHGWATSARTWGAVLPELVGGHRTVALDWRGCGRSGRPVHGNDVDGVVADLVAVIEALALERPVVVGSSIGGTFATELGLRHADRVGGVVSVDGPAYWPSTGMPIDRLLAGLRDNRAGTVADWVPNWYAPGAHPALIDWTVRQILDSGVYIDAHVEQAARYDPRPRLPELRVPIQYIHGERDAEIPLDVPRSCAALTPGAEVTAIAGAGHLPHQERPAEFVAALRAALARMSVTTPAVR
jgi:pimeloyl-ACP methyl ester carboxylesterase